MRISLPIVLAHGICPFDTLLRPAGCRDNSVHDRFHYFRNIRTSLLANGHLAHHSRVSWAASLDRRAEGLRNNILQLTQAFAKWPGVHIIAHSMGGLDSRWMIHKYRMEERIVSLTTIGTPHLGSSYADIGVRKNMWLIKLSGRIGLSLEGFKDLTRAACMERNQILADFEKNNGVKYQTIAGVQPLERTSWPLRHAHKIIRDIEGENDGLVSLKSAAWNDAYFVRKIDADHLNQIGWWNKGQAQAGLDRKAFQKKIQQIYLDIAEILDNGKP